MAEGGKPEQKGEKPSGKPESREAVKQNVDSDIRQKAEKLLSEAGFKDKLKLETIKTFAESHSKENYKGYREWNKDFCKTVLEIEESEAAENMMRIMALQIFLNEKVKGFTEEHNRKESIDGKLGPFTLSKLNEYYEILKPAQPKAQETKAEQAAPGKKPEEAMPKAKETAPGVINRLPEGIKFSKDQKFYFGDSIMKSIAGMVDDSHKIALVSSHLVKTPKFDNEKYRRRHIFIEEKVMEFLKKFPLIQPSAGQQPKVAVAISGGGNDLAARGRTDQTRKEIIAAYGRMIKEAHERGVALIIYASNDEADANEKKHISIFKWLREESGADVLIDMTKIVADRWVGIHPTAKAYSDLYASLNNLEQFKQA